MYQFHYHANLDTSFFELKHLMKHGLVALVATTCPTNTVICELNLVGRWLQMLVRYI